MNNSTHVQNNITTDPRSKAENEYSLRFGTVVDILNINFTIISNSEKNINLFSEWEFFFYSDKFNNDHLVIILT